jgi:DNA-binding LacI/PurR family transcriptional regulator
MPTRPTIYDVARLAHVSHGTVSRVINDRPQVAPTTRALVLAAMAELGFSRNEAAYRLKSPRAAGDRIGVIVEQLAEVGSSGNTVAALAELQAAGYRVDLATVAGGDESVSVRAALTAFEGSTCGILALAQTERTRAALLDYPAPVPVYIDRFLDRGTPEQPGAEELIGRAAAEHLAERGHHRVLHLPGPAGSLAAGQRRDAFVAHATALGLAVEVGPAGDWTSASGHELAGRIRPHLHTAVFVANDAMAIGLLNGLRGRSIWVPDQLAVLGVDDAPEAQHLDPQLSSVRHDLAAEGRLAAHLLIAAIRGTPEPDPAEYLHVHVSGRASTVPAPA